MVYNQAPLLVTALARQAVAATQPDAAVALASCLMLLLPVVVDDGDVAAAVGVGGGTGRLGATYSLAIHILAGKHAQVRHTERKLTASALVSIARTVCIYRSHRLQWLPGV